MQSTIAALLILTASAHAADWPQWLGPQRNGVSNESGLALSWPADGPKTQWRIPLGKGFSGNLIVDLVIDRKTSADGRIYIRSESELVCLDVRASVQ